MRSEQLDAIEELAKASSDGDLKWGKETFDTRADAIAKMAETFNRADSLDLHSVFRDDPKMSLFAAYTGNGPTSAANARFFAGARRIVLELIGEVRDLATEVTELRAAARDAAELPLLREVVDACDRARKCYCNLPTCEALEDVAVAYSKLDAFRAGVPHA